MEFEITPEEARPCAGKFASYLKKTVQSVSLEKAAWSNAPYRTTFFHQLNGDVLLYEVQGSFDFHDRLVNFVQWINAQRFSAELWIVVGEESDVSLAQLDQLKRNGVGLYFMSSDGEFQISQQARNPALQVVPDPRLKYGDRKSEVVACVKKFNDGHRKDGLRDLCELVEGQTEKVLLTAARKGWINITEPVIRGKDWSDQINAMGSKNIMNGGRDALVDSKLKDDLHSFRGARNLVDHKVNSKREDQKRQRQFPERMMMGTRLVSDLLSLQRKIK